MELSSEKRAFVRAALDCGALRLDGPFRLKSGLESPYFFDVGRFSTGKAVGELFRAYVAVLERAFRGTTWPDILFGPAYKGIPLAVGAALLAYELHGAEMGWLFDRKEPKRHGEHSGSASESERSRARLVGCEIRPNARIVILDDVLTTARTKLEAIRLLRSVEATVSIDGLVIALDRQEAGEDGRTGAQRFRELTGIEVYSVLTARELLAALRVEGGNNGSAVEALERHLAHCSGT